jgi:hypothetical protein
MQSTYQFKQVVMSHYLEKTIMQIREISHTLFKNNIEI